MSHENEDKFDKQAKSKYLIFNFTHSDFTINGRELKGKIQIERIGPV
jgi:hypothetical protein